VGTPKRGRSFGRPGCREEENTKMDLKETEWERVEEIYMAHDWKGIETWVSIKFGKFLIRLVTVSFSISVLLHEFVGQLQDVSSVYFTKS
jgi:hypothetical protein